MIFGESLHTRTFSFEGVRFLFTFNSLKVGELFSRSWYNGNIITHLCNFNLIEIYSPTISCRMSLTMLWAILCYLERDDGP